MKHFPFIFVILPLIAVSFIVLFTEKTITWLVENFGNYETETCCLV